LRSITEIAAEKAAKVREKEEEEEEDKAVAALSEL